MKKIVITEFMDQAAVDSLSQDFQVIYDPKLVDTPETLLQQMTDADAIIVRNRTQVRGELLASAQKLKAVGRLGVGLDNIDLDACKQRDIPVFPATGANDIAVAEYVIACIFMLLRRAYHSLDAMTSGTWPRNQLMGNEVYGKKLGLVGLGSIAYEVCTRAKAMGMEVSAFDPYLPDDHPKWKDAKKQGFRELLTSSDVVSLHIPLTPETQNLIDEDAIQFMKKGSILINAARGGVVDEAALVEGLQSSQLGGAALDVFASEPLKAEGGQAFVDVPNLVLTPHIAGVTEESNVRVSAVTAHNVKTALEGVQ